MGGNASERWTERVRGVAQRWWGRSRLVRDLRAVSLWPKLRREGPDLAHLATYTETPVGAVQRDEGLLLHGLIRVIRPRTIVEIGFRKGHSAFNFLRALDADGRLYSYDIDPACAEVARRSFGHDPRFKLVLKSQDSLSAEDLDGRSADFVFIDGAHDLKLNQATFGRLLPLLSPEAILAVHDTGTYPRRLLPGWQWLLRSEENWVGDGYEGEPDERAFVNWILEEHPEFAQIHLHSARTVRCGLTLLQRSQPLPRPDPSQERAQAAG
jgi:predicted O-methyltransferase YrrM